MNLSAAQKAFALMQLAKATITSIKEAGELGVPGGTLYAAMMTQGASLEQFERFMSLVLASGEVVKRGQLYVGVAK